MKTITFKNLTNYMNEKELVESISDMPYALASAVVNKLGWVPAYSCENSTHNIDENYLWDLYDVESGYVELHTSIEGSFVTFYATLDEVIDANNSWLEYSEEDDEFNVIDHDEDNSFTE